MAHGWIFFGGMKPLSNCYNSRVIVVSTANCSQIKQQLHAVQLLIESIFNWANKAMFNWAFFILFLKKCVLLDKVWCYISLFLQLYLQHCAIYQWQFVYGFVEKVFNFKVFKDKWFNLCQSMENWVIKLTAMTFIYSYQFHR